MRWYFFLTCVVLFMHGDAQPHDYLKIQRRMKLNHCGEAADSTAVYKSIRALEALDTTQIMKNLDRYYIDLGMRYWLVSNLDHEALDKAIRLYSAALFHNPGSSIAHWNMAFAYSRYNDCVQTLYYYGQYKHYTKHIKLSEPELEQERSLLDPCKD